MSKYEQLKKKAAKNFKRLIGVNEATFNEMISIFIAYEKERTKNHGVGGRKSLSPEDKVLLMLSYYREYRILEHIGFDYGVSKSTASRTVREVENVLIKSGKFSLPSKRALYEDERIICAHTSKGTMHDFKLFKQSNLPVKPETCIYINLGYLGIKKQHENIQIPYKSSKLHPLTDTQKIQNKIEASARIYVEHVNAKLKIFQILTQKYRNLRKKFNLRFNLICGLVNFDRGFEVSG